MFGSGRVDRCGGREGKKSLRKNKQKKYEIEQKVNKPVSIQDIRLVVSPPPPPLLFRDDTYQPSGPRIIDTASCLVSRQFDRDLNAVLTRAERCGVVGSVCMSPDFAKCEDVVNLAKQWSGVIYACIGILPDVIKRTNDKLFDERLVTVHQQASTTPEVVAIQCGLDLSREIGTHYLQEKLLESQLELAQSLRLPVIVRIKDSADKVVEKVLEHRARMQDGSATVFKALDMPMQQQESVDDDDDDEDEEDDADDAETAVKPSAVKATLDSTTAAAAAPVETKDLPQHTLPVAVYGFCGDEAELNTYLKGDLYIMISGQICDPLAPEGQRLRALVPKIPRDRLLIMSDAPLFTPQTIEDAHVRSSKNEPSNLPYVYAAVAAAIGTDADSLAKSVTDNAMRFYALTQSTHKLEEVTPVPAVAAATTTLPATAAAHPVANTTTKSGVKSSKDIAAPVDAVKSKPADGKSKGKATAAVDDEEPHGKSSKKSSKHDDDDEVPAKSSKKGAKTAPAPEEAKGPPKKNMSKKAKRAAAALSAAQQGDHHSGSDQDSDGAGAKHKGAKGKRAASGAAKGKGKAAKGKGGADSDDDHSADEVKQKKPIAKGKDAKPSKHAAVDDDDDDDANAGSSKPAVSKKAPKTKGKPSHKKKTDSDEDGDDDSDVKEDDDDDEEEEAVLALAAAQSGKGKNNAAAAKKGGKGLTAAVQDEESDDDDDEAAAAALKAASGRAGKRAAKQARRASERHDSDDDDDHAGDAKKGKAASGKKPSKAAGKPAVSASASKGKSQSKKGASSVDDADSGADTLDHDDEEEENADDGAAEVKQAVQKSAAPSASSFPPTEVKYACKKCRKLLFTGVEVVPHVAPAADAKPAGKPGKDAKKDKAATAAASGPAACDMVFVKPQEWMRGADDGSDDEDTADSDDGLTPGMRAMTLGLAAVTGGKQRPISADKSKMECPKCSSKLGRAAAATLRCACGADSPAPGFAVMKNRVDVVLPIAATGTILDPDIVPEDWDATMERLRSEKTEDQKRKDQKKLKKQVLPESAKGNFSSFRNKDY